MGLRMTRGAFIKLGGGEGISEGKDVVMGGSSRGKIQRMPPPGRGSRMCEVPEEAVSLSEIWKGGKEEGVP